MNSKCLRDDRCRDRFIIMTDDFRIIFIVFLIALRVLISLIGYIITITITITIIITINI